MRIDELMRDAVTDAEVDGTRIADAARSRGTTLRRRRRLSALTGGGLAAAAVALGVTMVVPDGGASSGVASAPGSSSTALDGRSTAAVLASLIGDVSGGRLDDFAGQGLPGGAPDTFATMALTPTGEGAGVVQVHVQGRDMLRETPDRCNRSMRDCTRVELAGGEDVLLTYSSPDESTPQGPWRQRFATLLSPTRGIRVSVSASNGFDLPDEQWDVTRRDPVLSEAELRAIATDPVWAFEVPSSWAQAGADLAPYDDLDVPAEGDWVYGD